MSLSLPLLTASRVKSARACLRLHRYQYIEGLRPAREDDALLLGTLFHAALEAWWLAPENRLEAALTALDKPGVDPFDRAKARVMMIGYDARWKNEELVVLGVEVEFQAPLVNPASGVASRTWQLAGKIDAIVQRDGRPWLIEHKTSAEDITPGSDYWRRLKMDGQVSQYFVGAKALGHDVAGMIYDVIGKPSSKPRKATPIEEREYTKPKTRQCKECKKKAPAPGPHLEDGIACADGVIVTDPGGKLYANMREFDETPEEYERRCLEGLDVNSFQRGDVVRLDGEVDEHLSDVWHLATMLRDAERENRAPRNPDACVRWGKACAYFDLCTGVASAEDTTRFIRKTLHPELAGPQAA